MYTLGWVIGGLGVGVICDYVGTVLTIYYIIILAI